MPVLVPKVQRLGIMAPVHGGHFPHERMLGSQAPPVEAGEYSPIVGATAANNYHYHGGITIPYPKVYLVYWNGTAPYAQGDIEAGVQAIVQGGFLDITQENGSNTGTYAGVASANLGGAAGSTIDDATIQSTLLAAITGGTIPRPDYMTLYIVIMPPGVTVTAFGVQSCTYFCGYHGMLNDAVSFYSVHPDNSCHGCQNGFSAFGAYTAVLAHEIGEWATDPHPGTGWTDDNGQEDGDLCAWQVNQYGSWQVQPLYVNSVGCSFGQYNTSHTIPARHPRVTNLALGGALANGGAIQTGMMVPGIVGITAQRTTDNDGNIDYGFGAFGDVLHFTSTDPQAVLPAPVTPSYTDRGQTILSPTGITFKTPGTQTVTVTSSRDPALTATSVPFTVTSPNHPVSQTATLLVEAQSKHHVFKQANYINWENFPLVLVRAPTTDLNVEALYPRHRVLPPGQLIIDIETTKEVRRAST